MRRTCSPVGLSASAPSAPRGGALEARGAAPIVPWSPANAPPATSWWRPSRREAPAEAVPVLRRWAETLRRAPTMEAMDSASNWAAAPRKSRPRKKEDTEQSRRVSRLPLTHAQRTARASSLEGEAASAVRAEGSTPGKLRARKGAPGTHVSAPSHPGTGPERQVRALATSVAAAPSPFAVLAGRPGSTAVRKLRESTSAVLMASRASSSEVTANASECSSSDADTLAP
mmetsp:Transcript_10278/g.30483  ORF Transcript_10278/g.30483 Transcript_10278/m.30483 type:complete len:229 (-) Transcript_10278:1080-1766(-)